MLYFRLLLNKAYLDYTMIYAIYNLRRLDCFHQIKRENRFYVAPQPYHKINLAPGEMKTLFVPFFHAKGMSTLPNYS